MKLTQALAILGLSICTPIFAANADQAAIDTLQKQIASVQSETHAALAAQEAATQKAILDLQTQMQGQIAHLQTEMQQMQAQLTNEIKQVQTEAVKAAGTKAPVVSATPEPAASVATPVIPPK